MATLTRKITATAKANDLRPRWHVLDAEGQVLGRLAVRIAHLLKGKHKPNYSPHMLTGDFVIVINAAKVRVTGRKAEQKIYYSHSQYPGGLKEVPYERMMARHPTRIIEHAVKGMLPHNRLGRQMLRRLKVYATADHPHESQVSGSLKEAENDREEGVAWIGLPKPQYKKRVRKARKPAPVTPEASAVEETPVEAETPEEPTDSAAPAASSPEPEAQSEAPAEDQAPTAEAEAPPADDAPAAEVEQPPTETEAPPANEEPAAEAQDPSAEAEDAEQTDEEQKERGQ